MVTFVHDFDAWLPDLFGATPPLMNDVQFALQQVVILGSHIGIAGTDKIPHKSSDLPGISAWIVNNQFSSRKQEGERSGKARPSMKKGPNSGHCNQFAPEIEPERQLRSDSHLHVFSLSCHHKAVDNMCPVNCDMKNN
jgi:hypothetical protein